jgi:TrmH family RNA methyltransferase
MMDVASLLASARSDPELVLLEGFHALKHALRFGADVVAAVTADPDGLAALAAQLAPELDLGGVEPVAPALLGPRPHHTKVLAVARRPAFDAAAIGPGPVVLLEEPRHLGNVGAVVRVAAAAGAAAVLTTGARDPWEPAALRGSAGLHFALPVGRAEPGDAGDRPLVALDPSGAPLATLPPGALLAFGTERDGLSSALLARADARIAIPMRAGVSSLNLATAVAVVLYAGR